MKILFLPKWYPDSRDQQFGVFIQKHAKAVSLYATVAVLYVAPNDDFKDHEKFVFTEENGFPELVVYYKTGGKKNPFSKLIQLCRYLTTVWDGYKFIKRHFGKPDLFHVNILARPGILPFLLSKFRGIPYVITEQWSGYSYGDFQRKNWIDKFLCRLIGNHSKGIIAVSTALEKKMRACGFNSTFHIVPNIVEKIALPPTVPKKDPTIKMLNISDMDDSKKNISGIIEAFALIGANNPKVELHIIGGGQDEAIIKGLVGSKTKVSDRIFLYGRQNNDFVYNIMPTIDFLITNSYFETFSVATVEALINGKPVIVSKCGGPEDFITDDVGILYEVDNVNALAEAMGTMINNYGNYDPQKLSAYANDRFSYEAVGEKFLKIYQSILGEI